MTRSEFYRLLEIEIGLIPGTLKGDELLKDIPKWDSLAVLSFMAVVDAQLKIQIPVEKIAASKSLSDLERLLDGYLSS